MDGYKAYKYYLAIKLHFTTEKYNVFETRGNVKGTRDTFNSRNDRYIFEKLAQKYPNDKDIIQFFVSNFAYGNDTAIYGNGEADELFNLWTKHKQSISRVFVDDLTNVINFCDVNKLHVDNIFRSVDGELPVILNLYLAGKVNIETLSIVNAISPFIGNWETSPTIKIILGDKLLRVKKLIGFIKYDKEKLSKIFNHFIEELA